MADRPRVLIFSTAYAPFVGGAEIAVKEITDRIPDMEFVMLTARLRPDLPVHEKIGNVDVYRIGKGNRWDKIRLIWEGPKKAKELGTFNLVWSIMASYSGFAALRYKKKNPTVPYLLTLQEGDSKVHIYSRVWFVWPWFRQIFTKADRIQAISQFLVNWAKDMGAKCPIDVVPNGVDIGNFQDSRNKTQKTNNIITVSRLVPKNGVNLLVAAMGFLPQDVTLDVVGSGSEEENIASVIREKKLGNRVRLLGAVPNEQLVKYLHGADVFCRPSLSEGLGISFLEAMAAGVPIVAPAVGGIPDFLKDGETGLACTHDPKDIAAKIQKILDDSGLAERLRMNALKLVQEKYTWDIVAKQMINQFQSVV